MKIGMRRGNLSSWWVFEVDLETAYLNWGCFVINVPYLGTFLAMTNIE
jgi:hypothetical protein